MCSARGDTPWSPIQFVIGLFITTPVYFSNGTSSTWTQIFVQVFWGPVGTHRVFDLLVVRSEEVDFRSSGGPTNPKYKKGNTTGKSLNGL